MPEKSKTNDEKTGVENDDKKNLFGDKHSIENWSVTQGKSVNNFHHGYRKIGSPHFGGEIDEEVLLDFRDSPDSTKTENPNQTTAAAIIPAASLSEDQFKNLASNFLKSALPGSASAKIDIKSDKNTVEVNYQNVTIKRSLNEAEQTITVTGSDSNLLNLLRFFKSIADARSTNDEPGQLIFEITEPKPLTQEKLDELLRQINYSDDLQAIVKIQLPPLAPAAKPADAPASAVDITNDQPPSSTPAPTTATPPVSGASTPAPAATTPASQKSRPVTLQRIPKKPPRSWLPNWWKRNETPQNGIEMNEIHNRQL